MIEVFFIDRVGQTITTFDGISVTIPQDDSRAEFDPFVDSVHLEESLAAELDLIEFGRW